MEGRLKSISEMSDEEIIMHYGVPGMKWGVIRKRLGKARASGNQKAISKADAIIANTEQAMKTHSAGGEKAYSKEHYNHLKDAAWKVQSYDGNAERTLHDAAYSVRKKEPLEQRVSKSEVANALSTSLNWQKKDRKEMEHGLKPVSEMSYDESTKQFDGYKWNARRSFANSPIGERQMENSLKSVSEMTDEELLVHYGVPGMKWGVRRNLRKAGRGVSKFKKEIGPAVKKQHKKDSKRAAAQDEKIKKAVKTKVKKLNNDKVKLGAALVAGTVIAYKGVKLSGATSSSRGSTAQLITDSIYVKLAKL